MYIRKVCRRSSESSFQDTTMEDSDRYTVHESKKGRCMEECKEGSNRISQRHKTLRCLASLKDEFKNNDSKFYLVGNTTTEQLVMSREHCSNNTHQDLIHQRCLFEKVNIQLNAHLQCHYTCPCHSQHRKWRLIMLGVKDAQAGKYLSIK